MLADVALYELAFRDHLQTIGAHLVECALYQLRADALAAQFRRHLGMDGSDDASGELVIGRGQVALSRKLVAVFDSVVDDLAHSPSFLPVCLHTDAWHSRQSLIRHVSL